MLPLQIVLQHFSLSDKGVVCIERRYNIDLDMSCTEGLIYHRRCVLR